MPATFSQTPSKVLHLRNMPWECTEEELVQLCSPFGRVVNTMLHVGANRNQAFVEFAEVSQAVQMVTYFATSSDQAMIRGKTVYVQYSNRHEITNNKSVAETPGNVLLVTFEGAQPADVSIDVIHLVFSAFGFVHKIATFEKTAGFQALIQYTDATTATEAKNYLEGRSIPSYLLPEYIGTCNLRINFSAHRDLNIKFQSHRSRDYTNPYLPVNSTAIDVTGTLQPILGETEGNVLLASIENCIYTVTLDILHTVFSAYGTVQKISMFDKNGSLQALIQYPDVLTAKIAKEALEGHSIYSGGFCKLHLTYSHHTDLIVKNDEKSRDYTIPSVLPMPVVPAVPAGAGFGPGAPAGAGSGLGGPGAAPGWNAGAPAWTPDSNVLPPGVSQPVYYSS